MKKPDPADANPAPAPETPDAPASEPSRTTDAPNAADTPPAFDPAHEWPAEGGCYVRQGDGTLKKEG